MNENEELHLLAMMAVQLVSEPSNMSVHAAVRHASEILREVVKEYQKTKTEKYAIFPNKRDFHV